MAQPISRRTTVKAGVNAAWAIPVVTVAAAAPAYAVSGGPVLSLTGVSSAYGSDGPGAERPDRLDSLFTLTNTGGAPAAVVTVSVFIPGGLYDTAPSLVLTGGEFTALPTSGSAVSGWTLSAFRTTPLGVGQSTSLGSSGNPLRVQFQDPVATSPYRRWAGRPFTPGISASAAGATTVVSFPGVAESAKTSLECGSFGGSFSGDTVSLSASITNIGRKTMNGPLTLEIFWDCTQDGSRWVAFPASATSPQLGSGTLGGAGSFGDPWRFIWTYSPPRATKQSFDDPDSTEAYDASSLDFDVTITLGGSSGGGSSRALTLIGTAPDVVDYPFILGSDNIPGS